MPYDRGIACLHEHNCDVLSIDHYCGHLTLLIAFRGSFFSVNSHLDMLSNKSFSQKLLGVRRKCRLFWIRWFRIQNSLHFLRTPRSFCEKDLLESMSR